MRASTEWPGRFFLYVWFAALVLVAGVVVLTARWRLRRGKPIRRPRHSTAVFEEGWCSIGERPFVSQNCVWVVLVPDRLITGLHFPLGVVMPARLVESMGLEIEVPSADIVSTEPIDVGGHTGVRITYRSGSDTRRVDLWLRKRDALYRLLQGFTSRGAMNSGWRDQQS